MASPVGKAAEQALIAAPPIEVAHLLLGACADLRTAQSLLCLNTYWVTQVTKVDSSWMPLTKLIADEGRLFYCYAPPEEGSPEIIWRELVFVAVAVASFTLPSVVVKSPSGRSTSL